MQDPLGIDGELPIPTNAFAWCCGQAEAGAPPRWSGSPSRITVLVSRNGSNPSMPPSRPIPDYLKPPNAIEKSVRKLLWPTVPDRRRRAAW